MDASLELLEGRHRRKDDRSAAVAWRRCIFVVRVGGVGGTEESVELYVNFRQPLSTLTRCTPSKHKESRANDTI